MEKKKDLIIVLAKIQFKKTEDGGRITPLKSGYRPNHVFEKVSNPKLLSTYIGDLEFDEQELIYPGETKIVTVRFLKNESLEKYITIGQKWFIYEVPNLIAEGEILEIL
jgi:hypothetical protein